MKVADHIDHSPLWSYTAPPQISSLDSSYIELVFLSYMVNIFLLIYWSFIFVFDKIVNQDWRDYSECHNILSIRANTCWNRAILALARKVVVSSSIFDPRTYFLALDNEFSISEFLRSRNFCFMFISLYTYFHFK